MDGGAPAVGGWVGGGGETVVGDGAGPLRPDMSCVTTDGQLAPSTKDCMGTSTSASAIWNTTATAPPKYQNHQRMCQGTPVWACRNSSKLARDSRAMNPV